MLELSTFTTAQISVSGLRVPEKIEREWGTGWYSKRPTGGTEKLQQVAVSNVRFARSETGDFKKFAYTFRHSHHNYEFSNNILLKKGIQFLF
jgi:hypothetical protein